MFEFQPWAPAAAMGIGAPKGIVDRFRQINRSMWSRADVDMQPDIVFEVVDLRTGRFDDQTVDRFATQLTDLLLADPDMCNDFQSRSRLLFVGGVRTLATREMETETSRAIKQDAEFFIRSLQNYEVAHYADVSRMPISTDEAAQAIRSALVGFSRYYTAKAQASDLVDLVDRLHTIRRDINNLITSARSLPEFEFLGSPENVAHESATFRPELLLREISLIYQFGKGSRPLHDPGKVLADLEARGKLTFDVKINDKRKSKDVEHSSYRLFVGMLAQTGHWAKKFHAEAVARSKKSERRAERLEIAEELAKRSFKLARYELLRDFGRVLGQGTLHRLRQPGADRPILLIDDEFHAIMSRRHEDPDQRDREHLIRRLEVVLKVVDLPSERVHIFPSEIIDAHLALMQADQLSSLVVYPHAAAEQSLATVDETTVPSLDGICLSGQEARLHSLDQYRAILIDPESRRDPCGPIRVQRLVSYLHHRFGPPRSGVMTEWAARELPPVLAFSRKESSGYVQQCLNMGASAFVPKARAYHLLFDLSRVLRDERRQRRPDDQASQFRILKSLKPHVAAKLLRRSGPSYIYGGIASKSGDHIDDPHEERWVRNLPKADLHYHFGTAIAPDIMAVLALNSAGHFLVGADGASDPDRIATGSAPLLEKLAKTLTLTWRLEHSFLPLAKDVTFSRLELMAAAASALRFEPALENRPFGLGDAIIDHLLEPNDRCDGAHATALLVAMMVAQEDYIADGRVSAYLAAFKSLAARGPAAEATVPPPHFTPQRALRLEMARAQEHFDRVACRWNGSSTRDEFERLAAASATGFWDELESSLLARVASANMRLHRIRDDHRAWANEADKEFTHALKWIGRHNPALRKAFVEEPTGPLPTSFALADYVVVPEVEKGRGLQLYLRGADFLGSAHLQYPENLWIAALGVTWDNAHDNIIYSEVRCETTGYTKAGMGAHDATEMLRHGFNLASLYVAGLTHYQGRRQLPLVRTNILLAAKRHKKEWEARAVVQLLEAYLERRAAQADAARSRRTYEKHFGQTIPQWWRPCDVVGFDLSGDETKDQNWLKSVITPLAARSSPVTIHAGEAASAASIWRAVYELNALRIGHGLRLSEDIALLSYCVREGICMELCPNSNRYTNLFDPSPRRDVDKTGRIGPLRYEYPLLHYMHQGMEVSLGTDNRYLHQKEQRTLTSEYMTAARLVGGLTRWEVLQIVKAGFKNAFVDKVEVRGMIEAVEEEIYRIVATDNG